jgi:HEAT repeat protein
VALRGLVELASARSFTLRLEANGVTVEGAAMPPDMPLVPLLAQQLGAHGVSEVHVAHHAPPADLMSLAKALAPDLSGYAPGETVEQRLRQQNVTAVSVVTAATERAAAGRRQMRVTDAVRAAAAPGALPVGSEPLKVIHGKEGAAYAEMEEHRRAALSPLAAALRDWRAAADGPAVTELLNGVMAGVAEVVKSRRPEQAVDAVVAIMRYEAELPEGDLRRKYGIALRRMLNENILKALSPLLLDPLYARDVGEIMQRAGTQGTQHLLELLVNAGTFAERRALLDVLRKVKDGTDMVINMLRHPDWFVVRNVADLTGELRVEEAIPHLGKALEHEDARVRKSAAVALAKIGTPSCARHLQRALNDADAQVRLRVAAEIGGKGLAGLAMSLMSAAEREENPSIKLEVYRALGRIGTPEAVEALRHIAEPGGRFVGRRPTAPRVAAVEGLGLARTDTAVALLKELADDRDGEVKKAARKALDAIARAPAPEAGRQA